MPTELQVINDKTIVMMEQIRTIRFAALLLFAFALALIHASSGHAQSRPGTTTPPTTQNPQTSTPPGTTPQGRRPGALPPGQTELPPNAGAAPVSPGAEAQQSAQPNSTLQQQRQQTAPSTNAPLPTTPQISTPGQTSPPGGQPTTATPAGTTPPQAGAAGSQTTGGVTGTPGQNVGVSSGIAPAQLPTEPPPIAPGYEAPVRELPSAERVGVQLDQQTPLSLSDAIRLALENNNDLESARTDVRIAEFDLTGARGVYDPLFSSESFYERSTTPTSSVIGGGSNGSVTQTNATGGLRFGGFSPFAGGSYQLDFSSTRLTTNNRLVSLNPQFPTALTLTYTQPLLRGLRIDDNRRRIEIAKRNLSLTDAQFRQRAIETVTQVEASYWDLAFALRHLQVQIDAVKQARTQVESNRRLVQQGVLAPIDLVAADAQVTTFEQSVYSAQEAVTRAENALKTLLLPNRTDPTWMRPIVPVTSIDLEAPRVALEQAVTSAIENRPELAQIETNREINRINERFFRDQSRPQVDLVGTYNPVGLAGTFVPRDNSNPFGDSDDVALRERINLLSAQVGLPPLVVVPSTGTGGSVNENLVGGYGQSIGNLIGQNYPSVRVGVRVQIPFRNRTAQANLGRSLAQGSQIESLRQQTEQLIEADVRNNLQSVRSAEARLASAAAARSSAEQQFASEQRQFNAGLSTVFLVLQRQTELLAARGRELQAQTDLNKSIASFQRAMGTTLSANNVSLHLDSPRGGAQQAGNSEASDALTTDGRASNMQKTNNSVVLTPVIAERAATKTEGANSFAPLQSETTQQPFAAQNRSAQLSSDSSVNIAEAVVKESQSRVNVSDVPKAAPAANVSPKVGGAINFDNIKISDSLAPKANSLAPRPMPEQP